MTTQWIPGISRCRVCGTWSLAGDAICPHGHRKDGTTRYSAITKAEPVFRYFTRNADGTLTELAEGADFTITPDTTVTMRGNSVTLARHSSRCACPDCAREDLAEAERAAARAVQAPCPSGTCPCPDCTVIRIVSVITEPLGLGDADLPAYGKPGAGACRDCGLGPVSPRNLRQCIYCSALEDLNERELPEIRYAMQLGTPVPFRLQFWSILLLATVIGIICCCIINLP